MEEEIWYVCYSIALLHHLFGIIAIWVQHNCYWLGRGQLKLGGWFVVLLFGLCGAIEIKSFSRVIVFGLSFSD